MNKAPHLNQQSQLAPEKWKCMFRNLLLVLISCVISLSACELFVRIYFQGRYAPRPNFTAADADLGLTITRNLNHVFFGRDFSIAIKTDEDGYRLGKLGPVDYTDKLILLVGDSYTFGWGVNTDETFASYLDELVWDASGKTARIVNLGVPGYGTIQSERRMAAFFSKHPKADCVIAIVFLHADNDPTDNTQFLLFKEGIIEYSEKTRPERSISHLVNLVQPWLRSDLGELQTMWQNRKQDAGKNSDNLYAVDYIYHNKEKPTIVVDGKTVSVQDLLENQMNAVQTVHERRSMLFPQDFILDKSLVDINQLAEDRNIPILHFVHHFTVDWYYEHLQKVLTASTDAPNVIFAGKIPIKGFDGPFENAHSGGHFTPKLNRHIAKEFFHRINDLHLLN